MLGAWLPVRALGAMSVLLSVLVITGCASQGRQSLYRWGDYEPLIYQQYIKPGKAEPGIQVDRLSADIQRTLSEDRRVPPGEHAQLGYMQYQIGNRDQAIQEFETEKSLFPESAVLMDRLIGRARAGGGS